MVRHFSRVAVVDRDRALRLYRCASSVLRGAGFYFQTEVQGWE